MRPSENPLSAAQTGGLGQLSRKTYPARTGRRFTDGPRGPDQASVVCHPMTAAVAPAVLRSLRRRRPPGGPVGITPDATGGCTVPCILQVHESCEALSRKEPLRRFG
jgi:hypothetical protein